MKQATASAAAIIDMSPWANDFAEWRREQAELASAATVLGLESDVDAYAGSVALKWTLLIRCLVWYQTSMFMLMIVLTMLRASMASKRQKDVQFWTQVRP